MAPELNKMNLGISERLQRFSESIQEALSLIFSGFHKAQKKDLDKADGILQASHALLDELQSQVSVDPSIKAEDIAVTISIINNYKKVLFNLEKISFHTMHKNREGILFTEKAVTELEELFRGLNGLLSHMNDVVKTQNPVLIDYILREKRKLKKLARDFSLEHQERLIKGVCMAQSSSTYLYIVEALEDILWHLQAIVDELKK